RGAIREVERRPQPVEPARKLGGARVAFSDRPDAPRAIPRAPPCLADGDDVVAGDGDRTRVRAALCQARVVEDLAVAGLPGVAPFLEDRRAGGEDKVRGHAGLTVVDGDREPSQLFIDGNGDGTHASIEAVVAHEPRRPYVVLHAVD